MIISWTSDPMIDGSSDSHHLKVVITSSEIKFQVPCKVSKRGASKGKRYTSKVSSKEFEFLLDLNLMI